MNNTSISSPKGQERQAVKIDNFNEKVNEGIKFVRSQLTERVLNPNAITYKNRDLILNVLNAETV